MYYAYGITANHAGMKFFSAMFWLAMVVSVFMLMRGLLRVRPRQNSQNRTPVRRACSNCGTLHLAHARFCPRCGKSV